MSPPFSRVRRSSRMVRVTARDLPPGTVMQGYRDSGDYTDCFVAIVAGRVSQARFVEAFYTSRLFRLERLVLALLVAKPSTDDDARRLAIGEAETFAAWRVEARAPDQILLCDYQSLTRSWLMTAQGPDGEPPTTRLLFGTVVAPRRREGARRVFSALGGLHRVYARALLRSAVARLAVVSG